MGLFRPRGRTILSIDGGGIRGIIPARVLVEIGRRLTRCKKERPFHELFDLVAGTSTGGLLALALCAPGTDSEGRSTGVPRTSPDEILSIYVNRGGEIFPRTRFNRLRSLKQAFYEKYDSGPFEAILRDVFGGVTLKQALTSLLVTAYDTEARAPLFFKNRPSSPDWNTDPDFLMRDVARATSAAPTYFEPARIGQVPDTGKRYTLVDGGVFANNPAMCAYMEARKLFPREKRFFILSLGTGSTDRPFPYEQIRKWGYVDWVNPAFGVPLSSVMMDGQGDCVDHLLTRLPGVTYLRINGPLDEGLDLMDDASPEKIEGLARFAESLIERFDSDIDLLCSTLGRR